MLRLGGAFGEERLLERAVRVAEEAGCRPVVVVLGADAETIRESCRLGTAEILLNEEWPEGMAASVRAGIAALGDRVDAVVLMTCDQPAVTEAHLRELMQAGSEAGSGAVGSGYAGRIGVPALIPAGLFEELCGLRGDEGARGLLRGRRKIDLPGGEVDIDTREMLEAAQRRFT